MEITDDPSSDFEGAEDNHADEAGAAAIDPRKMSRQQLAAYGHTKRPIMSVIRAKCLDCCGGSWLEVAHCTTSTCPLWAYRTGKNVFSERTASPAAMAALQAARVAKRREEEPAA